ncbi:hypothetical protein Thiowin_01260 [Thiorhodovibrio winogradskyi]|uniref:Cbb3-type cytochrome c oxidase subunit 3 n=1 Tax=Thiorhodovibrio winogradskyi TaxID=77007 RepID=A0ABZ0S5Q0_9GAMM|nr:cbb3-type cytochrome c oxidase subunit 3 [Thiorhodovibrio winogradskyi]
MNSLAEYFHTDWQAMTATDWFGTLLTVAIAALMALAYFQVFRPKHREGLEARKYLLFEEDSPEADPVANPEADPVVDPGAANRAEVKEERNGGGHG